MKKLLIYLLVVSSFTFVACDKEETEGVSNLTTYAVIDFEDLVVVPLGESFTPAGTASEGGASLTVDINSNVDTNTVGIYSVVYSATNSDGFDASGTQVVVVHDPSIVGTDVSGNIQDTGRNERKGVISLVEGTSSIFFVTDFAFGGAFPMYFQMDGDVISEIPQAYVFGVTSVDLTYDPVIQQFTTLVNPYGFDYIFEYDN